MTADAADVLVVGAGPAGLATSGELRRRGVPHVVLERGPHLAHTWGNLYDSLTLHTGKHMSALPGMPFPSSVSLFPTRGEFVSYLQRYAAGFNLPVETGRAVTRVERAGAGWIALRPTGLSRHGYSSSPRASSRTPTSPNSPT